MNLSDISEFNHKTFGEYTSLYFEGKTYTNTELRRMSRRLAGGLAGLGLSRGDIVVCHLPNCPEVAVLYNALALTGMVICPTLFLLGPREMADILDHSGAKAVVTSPEFYEKIRDASAGIDALKHIIVSGGEGPGLKLDELMKGRPDTFPPVRVGEHEMAVLLYTSGTTGTPKGVMLSGANIHFDAHSSVKTNRVERSEVALSALPLSHSYGLTMAFASQLAGTFSILQRWFNPAEVLDLTERFGVTSMVGVPTMYTLILAQPGITGRALSSWRRLQVGGAQCPASLHEEFEKKLGIRLLEGYGLSEASPVVACNRPGLPIKAGSVGRPLDGVEVRIADDTGRTLGARQTGELCVRGQNVMLGYYKLPHETEKTIIDGWLHTGDMGYLDDDGYIFLVERKKDLIIRGGFNIFPGEVEQVLMEHPGVAEAAVAGMVNDTYGEEVKAFVVLRKGASVPESEIIEYCRVRLAAYKCPRAVEFRSSLPRNILGKVLRRQLRENQAPS